MAVPTTITDLSVTAASNVPAGTDTVTTTTGPDEYFRALSAILRMPQAKGADVASATASGLGSNTDGDYFHVTGTTGIAASNFGTVSAGIEKIIVFDGALTLTHNATSFILPGGANITTAAGDVAVFRSEGSGNWKCINYVKYSLAPGAANTATTATSATTATTATTATNIAGGASGSVPYQTAAGTTTLLAKATDGQVLTLASGVPSWATPSSSPVKAWVNFDGTASSPTAASGYNIASITKNGTGDYTLTFSTPMANANYCVTGNVSNNAGTTYMSGVGLHTTSGSTPTTKTVNAVRVRVYVGNSNVDVAFDSVDTNFVICGN